MSRATPLRFLAVAMRPSADLLGFALVVITCAALDAIRRPRFFDECYALALVFQMFSASTGFRERAVRGHFDPLLTRCSRRSLALAHLTVSSWCGALVWMSVTAVDVVIAGRTSPGGLHASALAAFVCVSLVAWAVGLLLPRYGAGIVWLTAIVALAGSGHAAAIRSGVLDDPAWTHRVQQVACLLVAPMLLFAGPAPTSPLVLLIVLMAATGAAIGGVVYVVRFDAVLQEVA